MGEVCFLFLVALQPKEDTCPGLGQLVPIRGKFGSECEMQRCVKLRSHHHISGTLHRPDGYCRKDFVVVPVAKSLDFPGFCSFSKLGLLAF